MSHAAQEANRGGTACCGRESGETRLPVLREYVVVSGVPQKTRLG
jgi:hypothetical protein